MRRVLVLRPEPGATATIQRARQLGLDAVSVPLFEIEPIVWIPPEAGDFDALLLTSANAVRHGGEGLNQLRGLPVYAVGSTTADSAREAGFEVLASGDGGVDPLVESTDPRLRLLHLCGEDHKDVSAAPQRITSVPVYRARERQGIDLSAAGGAIVLIHSPRAGRRFVELVADRASITIAAISPEAAKAAGIGWDGVEAADTPSDEALLALAARLCNISPAQ